MSRAHICLYWNKKKTRLVLNSFIYRWERKKELKKKSTTMKQKKKKIICDCVAWAQCARPAWYGGLRESQIVSAWERIKLQFPLVTFLAWYKIVSVKMERHVYERANLVHTMANVLSSGSTSSKTSCSLSQNFFFLLFLFSRFTFYRMLTLWAILRLSNRKKRG